MSNDHARHLSRRGRRARRRAAPQTGRDEARVQGQGRVTALDHELRAPRGDGGREGLRDDAARRPVQIFDDAEAQRHAEERIAKRNEKARSRVLGICGFNEVRLRRATDGGDRGGVGRGARARGGARRRRRDDEEDVRGGGASDVREEEKTQGRV